MKIKRLDHHGIVSGVIDDLGIVELIDQQIHQDEQQEISTGEAVKGMIMNGLGFSNRPLSLSPQFFTNLPMEHLFRAGVEASHFNRHKLGRTLDQCYEYGTSQLFSLISEKACREAEVNTTYQSLDTTSYSLSGDYESTMEEEDSTAIHITHGYSKDHRPDLKQVVQEMIVSQDGVIPLACRAWDGNASDNKIFKARTQALIQSFQSSSMPQYLVADSKLYHQDNAQFLSQVKFITLVPSTIKREKETIHQSLTSNQWIRVDDNYRYQSHLIEHMDISQRWIVVHSKAAQGRAKAASINKYPKHTRNWKKIYFICKHSALLVRQMLIKRWINWPKN